MLSFQDDKQFLLQNFHGVVKLLAITNFIKIEETNSPQNFDVALVHDKTVHLERHLHAVLCSMNKALRKLHHSGIEAICRHLHIQQLQLPNTCIFESDLLNYVRSLELFRYIKRVNRKLFDGLYSSYFCFDTGIINMCH